MNRPLLKSWSTPMLSLPNIAKLRKSAVPSKSGNSIAPKRPMQPRCCLEIGLRISRDVWPKIAKLRPPLLRRSSRRPGVRSEVSPWSAPKRTSVRRGMRFKSTRPWSAGNALPSCPSPQWVMDSTHFWRRFRGSGHQRGGAVLCRCAQNF